MKSFNTAMYIAFEKALAATLEHTRLSGKVFRALRSNRRTRG